MTAQIAEGVAVVDLSQSAVNQLGSPFSYLSALEKTHQRSDSRLSMEDYLNAQLAAAIPDIEIENDDDGSIRAQYTKQIQETYQLFYRAHYSRNGLWLLPVLGLLALSGITVGLTFLYLASPILFLPVVSTPIAAGILTLKKFVDWYVRPTLFLYKIRRHLRTFLHSGRFEKITVQVTVDDFPEPRAGSDKQRFTIDNLIANPRFRAKVNAARDDIIAAMTWEEKERYEALESHWPLVRMSDTQYLWLVSHYCQFPPIADQAFTNSLVPYDTNHLFGNATKYKYMSEASSTAGCHHQYEEQYEILYFVCMMFASTAWCTGAISIMGASAFEWGLFTVTIIGWSVTAGIVLSCAVAAYYSYFKDATLDDSYHPDHPLQEGLPVRLKRAYDRLRTQFANINQLAPSARDEDEKEEVEHGAGDHEENEEEEEEDEALTLRRSLSRRAVVRAAAKAGKFGQSPLPSGSGATTSKVVEEDEDEEEQGSLSRQGYGGGK